MKRRSFLASLATVLASLFGVGKTRASESARISTWELNEATVPWIIERVGEDVQRPFNAQVVITTYHCGNGNCPAPKSFYEGFKSPEDEGFSVIVTTPKYRYRISVKANYLGCTMSNLHPDPGETWTRGCDLSDGKRTVGTWHEIVEDIKKMENTGSKYYRREETT